MQDNESVTDTDKVLAEAYLQDPYEGRDLQLAHPDRSFSEEDYEELAGRYRDVPLSIRLSVKGGRAHLGLSQEGLAKELAKIGLHLDASAITRIENGKRAVRADEAWAFAAVLRQDLEALIPETTSLWSLEERLEFVQKHLEWNREWLRRAQRAVRESEAEVAGIEERIRRSQP